MKEIVKQINDTNASFRTLTAGDAKNTDLFFDNAHYELFKNEGETITVRFSKKNLTQAIVFISSILPRKYDSSSIHEQIDFSISFVYKQLAMLDGLFLKDGRATEYYTQEWKIRKNVEKKNGEIDSRFYFKNLLSEFKYNLDGQSILGKFTVRNYLAGGYSKLHIIKANDRVFDVWIENAIVPNTEISSIPVYTSSSPLQLIYFGTPGSGKSHKVKENLKGVATENVFRTTFHPDSDYASFVGCYKPTIHQGLGRKSLSKAELVTKFRQYKQTNKGYVLHRFCATHPEFGDLSKAEKDEFLVAVNESTKNYVEINKAVACANELSKFMTNSDITYSFIPQVFTNAYVQAWKKQAEAIEQEKEQAEKVYLVIEEINRGNCAQIFGDLFQLLDRKEDGTSTYKIRADQDLANYLMKELGENHDGIKGGNLRLPGNLHIIATMNTSDQSLFPMDSAFKRRWDWEYVPIDYSENVDSGQFLITIDKKTYRWVDFLKAVNERILSATDSEDKQMGNFFIKHSVEEKEFKSKVMFYLWHEVCKDEYHTKNNFFRTLQDNEEEEFSFNELHGENGMNILVGFMQYIGVDPIEDKTSQEEDGTPPNDAEENNAEE